MISTLCLLLLSAALAGDVPHQPPSPFVIRNDRGDELRVRFLWQVQATLDASSEDDWQLEEALRFRRARLVVGTRVLDGKVRTGMQLSPLPGALELLDLWGSVKLGRGLSLKVGQFKVPWTRFRAQPFASLLMVDWPGATKHFGAERQLGLAVSDGVMGGDAFGWSLGVFAGANARASFATGIGEAHAEMWDNPSSLLGPKASYAIHPEVIGRVTFGTPGIDAKVVSDLVGGELRWIGALSVAWDAAPVEAWDFALRLSPELLIKAGGVSVNLVGYAGFFASDDPPMAPAALGYVGELAWRFVPCWGVVASVSQVDHLVALRDTARDRADAVIAAADPDEREALELAYSGAGARRAELELGAGVDWWVASDAVKLQLDGAWVRVDTGSVQDAMRVRLQTQVAF